MLTPDTESAILVLARSTRKEDHAAAHERLVAELSRPLFRLCAHVTNDKSDAEDALQDTLLAVYRALPSFRGEARLSTWIYRIAIRAALDIKSRRNRRNEAHEDALASEVARGPLADEEAATRQRAERLAAAMEQLAPEQRTVLSLFALDGMRHQAIAEVLGVPEGTVWSRLHLARKKLAAALS